MYLCIHKRYWYKHNKKYSSECVLCSYTSYSPTSVPLVCYNTAKTCFQFCSLHFGCTDTHYPSSTNYFLEPKPAIISMTLAKLMFNFSTKALWKTCQFSRISSLTFHLFKSPSTFSHNDTQYLHPQYLYHRKPIITGEFWWELHFHASKIPKQLAVWCPSAWLRISHPFGIKQNANHYVNQALLHSKLKLKERWTSWDKNCSKFLLNGQDGDILSEYAMWISSEQPSYDIFKIQGLEL